MKLTEAQNHPHGTVSRPCQKGRHHHKNGATITAPHSADAQGTKTGGLRGDHQLRCPSGVTCVYVGWYSPRATVTMVNPRISNAKNGQRRGRTGRSKVEPRSGPQAWANSASGIN